MRLNRTALIGAPLAIALVAAGVAIGRQLGAREAREQIGALVGSPDAVRIKSIAPGSGGEAVVEAQVDLAFRMRETPDGWRVADVRLGPNQWENVDLLRHALDAEKARLAAEDLRALAKGVEAYRAERGFYPEAETTSALVDRVSPRFMRSVIRVDPWHNPYLYRTGPAGFRLSSAGPDGKPDTGDDVVVTATSGGS